LHHPAFDALVPLGWDDRIATLFAEIATPGTVPARVARVDRTACVVLAPDGAHRARAALLPAVGDWVAVDNGTAEVVVEVVPPWSRLTRRDPLGHIQVLAANIDVVFITAPADRLNPARIERETAMAWDSGATPVVLITKSDLAGGVAVEALSQRLLGVEVAATSAVNGDGLDRVNEILQPHRSAVLLGPSGAGKSSLVNALLGDHRLATGAVRAGDGRGRHTTTHRQLLVVAGGGVVIDTPGLRSLSLAGDGSGVGPAFADIEDLAVRCRFGDCRHNREPGCAVAAAVSRGDLNPGRLANFHKLQREIDFDARRHDPLARQQVSRSWKAQTKAMRKLPKKR
jgi:ribosome biogenesis GTPase